MFLSVICLYIGTLHNSVPRKRFIRYQMPRIAVFVPQKRFKSYKLRQLDRFVPQKRFNRDKRHYFQEIEEMSL